MDGFSRFYNNNNNDNNNKVIIIIIKIIKNIKKIIPWTKIIILLTDLETYTIIIIPITNDYNYINE
jgi:hypothetical protein